MRSELFRDLNPQRRREIETEVLRSRINTGEYQSRHALSPVGLLDNLSPEDEDEDEDETGLSGPVNRNLRSRLPSGSRSNSTSTPHDSSSSSLSVHGWNPYRSLPPRPESTYQLPYDEARRRLLGNADSRHQAALRAQQGHIRTSREDAEHGADTLRRDVAALHQSCVDRASEVSRLRRLLITGEGTNTQASRPDMDERARELVAMAIVTRRMAGLAGMDIGGTATRTWARAHGRLRRRDSDEETLPPYSPAHAEDLEDPPPAYAPVVGRSPGGSTNGPDDTTGVDATTRESTGNDNPS